jgi:hypothetical protein
MQSAVHGDSRERGVPALRESAIEETIGMFRPGSRMNVIGGLKEDGINLFHAHRTEDLHVGGGRLAQTTEFF